MDLIDTTKIQEPSRSQSALVFKTSTKEFITSTFGWKKGTKVAIYYDIERNGIFIAKEGVIQSDKL